MPAPVVIELRADGIEQVKKALRSVGDSFVELDRRVSREAKAQAKERVRVTRDEGKQKERAADASAKEQQRIAIREANEERRLFAQRMRERARHEREVTRATERESMRRQQVAERAARQEAATMARWERQKETIRRNSAVAAGRIAIRESEAEQHARAKLRSTIGAGVGRGVSAVLGGGARLAGVALGVGGGFAISSAVGSEVSNRGKASEIAIQSEGKLSGAQVYDAASAAGTAYGKGTSEVLSGVDQFIAKSGSPEMAMKTMGELLKLSNATGASFEDLGRVAGQIFASDKTQSAEKLVQLMRDLGAQGRAASVDMRELAEYAARISGGAAEFGGDKGGVMRTLGGLAQLAAAKGGATSAAEATESVLSLGLDVNAHADKFTSRGIKTRDKDGMLLAPEEIIRSAVTKTKGDKDALLDMFGRRSYRAVAGFANTYLEAKGEGKAQGLTGEKLEAYAVGKAEAALAEFAKATISATQVNAENATRMKEADKQLESVMNDLRTAVGRELVPEITKAVPVVAKLAPQFSSLLKNAVALANWFADNPLKGIGAALSVAIAKEVAAAQLANVFNKAISTSLGSGLSIAAASIAITNAGMIAIDTLADKDVRRDKAAGRRQREALNIAGQLRADLERGEVDPAKLAKAKEISAALQGDVAAGPSATKTAGAALSSGLATATFGFVGDSSGAAFSEHARAAQTAKEALDLLTKSAQEASSALENGKANPSAPARNAPLSGGPRGGTQ